MAGVANRSTKVRLEADITAFIADMERAGKVTQNVAEQTASGAKQAAAIRSARRPSRSPPSGLPPLRRSRPRTSRQRRQKGRRALDEVAQVAAAGRSLSALAWH